MWHIFLSFKREASFYRPFFGKFSPIEIETQLNPSYSSLNGFVYKKDLNNICKSANFLFHGSGAPKLLQRVRRHVMFFKHIILESWVHGVHALGKIWTFGMYVKNRQVQTYEALL